MSTASSFGFRSVFFNLHLLLFIIFVFVTPKVSCRVASELENYLQARTVHDAIKIPIHTLPKRSPADNTTFGAALSSTSWSTDKQSYFTTIKAGNLSFRVNLDTGSSDLWLISTACSRNTCTNLPRYPLTYSSSTFVSLNNNATPFEVQYADGTSASGFVARETIGISNLTLANQVFGLVVDSNVSLADQTSGILGLGFPRLSTISTGNLSSPFFATLASRGLLEYPLFGLSLTKNSTGSLTIGAVDASVVTNVSLINWNKVAQFPPFGAESNTSSYFQWSIPIAGFSFNGTQLSPIPTYANVSQKGSLALFDAGSPGIYGPYQDVSRLFSLIDGARLVDSDIEGHWALPCDTTAPISFTFGSKNYTLLPTDYIIGPATGNPNLCLSWPVASLPSPDGNDWQMGSAFLRTVYSVFSFGIDGKEPPLIGLYPLGNRNITSSQNASYISSVISANSETLATTFPNFVFSTPTYTTPPFAFNTSVSASLGGIVSSGLASEAYSAIFGQKISLTNTSELPLITPPPSVVTIVMTNAQGVVSTTVSVTSMDITLGLPSAASPAVRQLHWTFVLTVCITIFGPLLIILPWTD